MQGEGRRSRILSHSNTLLIQGCVCSRPLQSQVLMESHGSTLHDLGIVEVFASGKKLRELDLCQEIVEEIVEEFVSLKGMLFWAAPGQEMIR